MFVFGVRSLAIARLGPASRALVAGFLVDLNGAVHEVSLSDVRYEVCPDGTQLIEIAIEPGHEDLVAGRWTLRVWPTFQLIDGVRLEIQQ